MQMVNTESSKAPNNLNSCIYFSFYPITMENKIFNKNIIIDYISRLLTMTQVNERNNFIDFKLETNFLGSHRLTRISKDGIEHSLKIYSWQRFKLAK